MFIVFICIHTNPLTFHVGIVDDRRNIETSCVKNTVNLVLPETVTVIATGSQVNNVVNSMFVIVVVVTANFSLGILSPFSAIWVFVTTVLVHT
jgi:hypothetical protein